MNRNQQQQGKRKQNNNNNRGQQQQQNSQQRPQQQQQQQQQYIQQSQRNTRGREFRRRRQEQKEREMQRTIQKQNQIEFTNWFNSISTTMTNIDNIMLKFQQQDDLEELFSNMKIHPNQLNSFITLMRIFGEQKQYDASGYVDLILRSSSFNTQIDEKCTLLLLYQNSIEYLNQELEILYRLFQSLKLRDYYSLKQSSIASFYNLLKIIELYNPTLQNKANKIFSNCDQFLKQIYSTAKVLEWRQIPIYPVELEFFSYNGRANQLFGKLEILQIGNKSLDLYLDFHFNLIREDYILEFKEAIISLNEFGFQNVNREKTSNIGLYQNIELLSSGMNNQDIVWKIQVEQFNMDGRKQKNINWAKSKKLASGSLICLTNIECYPLIFGVITYRDVKQNQYKNGKIQLEFRFLNLNTSLMQFFNLFSQKTILMQCEGLIDPILYYLESLKNKVSLPFANIIIENQNVIKQPNYLNYNPVFDIDISGSNFYQGNKFNIFQQPWPQLQTSLDLSQINAIKLMLQKEVALIQGPPGTGKTYCGALAVRLLYQNLQKKDFPILIVCYTNHALDQFLEHIIKFVPIEYVARLGGQSKNPILQQCQVRCRQKVDFEFREFNKLKKQMGTIIERMLKYEYQIKPKDLEKLWPELYQSIIYNFFCDNDLLVNDEEIDEDLYLQENGEQELIKNWIYCQKPKENTIVEGYLNGMNRYFKMDQILKQTQQFINLQKTPGLERQEHDSSDEELDEYLDSEDEANYNDNYKDLKFNSFGVDQAIKNFNELHQNQNLLHYTYPSIENIKSYLNQHKSNPWKLNPIDVKEILIYLECLRYQNDSIKFQKLYKQFSEQSNKLKDLYDENEIQILNSMKIIGVTVTGVAKQTNKLQKLNTKIMVIEEAAEVLESHIASILTSNLQHLILIGDHQQLKPSLKNYFLQEKLKANVSLFERLFLNKLPSVTLTSQRRMKTKFADFIRQIYGQSYEDHPDILKLNEKEVLGLEKDLVFFNHKWFEAQDENSKENKQEAQMIYQMVQYLLKCGHQQNSISVLTLYLKQAQILKRKFLDSKQNQIKVQTVDNYQGEENDIVIISLVRNNKKNILGYISIENRINVALSRARIGLYVFGNFDFIQKASHLGSTWQKMILLAQTKNCLNDYINTKCIPHGNCQTIRQPEDWTKIKPNLCDKKCLKLFQNCNHLCNKNCHISDCHPAETCPFQCDRIIDCGHKCKLLCKDKCKCTETVDLILPCNHKMMALCGTDPNNQKCQKKQQIQFSKCDHITEYLCYERQKYTKECLQICQRNLPCGHICNKICSQNCGQCEQECQKERPCGHKNKCKNKCYQNCSPCDSPVETKLICGHQTFFPCCSQKKDLQNYICQQQCIKKRLCGHDGQKCKNKCNQECSPCLQEGIRNLECGHDIQVKCSTADIEVSKAQCMKECKKKRLCGHDSICLNKCYQVCSPCLTIIKKTLNCGHSIQIECNKSKQFHLCKAKCEKKRPCNHNQICTNLCSEQCSPCNEIINHTFPCSHKQDFICSSSESLIQSFKCVEPCLLKRICGHNDPCLNKCYENKCSPCQQILNKKLDCGHTIEVKCYEFNQTQKCQQPCNKIRECGHIFPCSKLCSDQCQPCEQQVLKIQPCGHQHLIKCYQYSQPIICKEPCIKIRSCGHSYPCTNKCYQDCIICKEIVQLKLKCGHEIDVECFKSLLPQPNYICQRQCIKTRVCGHNFPCYNLCFKNDECTPCQAKIFKLLNCGHQYQILCYQSNLNIKVQCEQPCNKKRPCGHNVPCQKQCFESCTLCTELCQFQQQCGHIISIQCYQKTDQVFLKKLTCLQPCNKKRDCGHNFKCTRACHEICNPCKIEVQLILKCGHVSLAYCHQDPNKLQCTQLCKIEKKCGHSCRQLCGQPCLRCEEIITKKFPQCNHLRQIKCYENNQYLVCQQLVPKRYSCHKHSTQIPCFSFNSFSERCPDCKDCTIF
ncbi:unnamed protein product [Paramecium sonneborni]|uniref:NF-X1-type domain-containing protein n=1 Tax=Paramecium sonneborni TaxID=65129 RepID=A0A8S1LGK4_9CILI|nr:unnamed protein product [Paramecium sonneborni]